MIMNRRDISQAFKSDTPSWIGHSYDCEPYKFIELVKNQKVGSFVIPANPGSGPGQAPESSSFHLHKFPGLRFSRSDDFLRDHQIY